jgi:hypothetical protein
MLSEWMAVFSTPQSIARSVIRQFVGYLERQAYERLWKARSTATAELEQQVDSTRKAKTSKHTGPRGEWSDGCGYITREGACVCSALLAAHENEKCPGLFSDPNAEDERLLESLIGRRLKLMEWIGRIPFIRVCE